MPNVSNDPRTPNGDNQDFATVSIPRITQEMIEQARQNAPTPENQWDRDRAAAQRAAQATTRRRSRGFNPFSGSTPTLTPRSTTPPAAQRPAALRPPRPTPSPSVDQPPEATESIAQFFATYKPPTSAPTQAEAGDTTMTFTLPAAYNIPSATAQPAAPRPAQPRPGPKPAPVRPVQPEPAPKPEPPVLPPVQQPTPPPIQPPKPVTPRQKDVASAFDVARSRAGRTQIARPKPVWTTSIPSPAEDRTREELEKTVVIPIGRTPAEPTPEPVVPVPVEPPPALVTTTSTRPPRRTRAQAEAALYQSIHDDHLWLNNPVLVRGLGLAPAIVAVTSANIALQFCLAAVLMLTATRVLAVALSHLLGHRQRPLLYALSAAVVYVPAYCVLYAIYGADLTLLGIYLPLLVVDPVIIKRMEAQELESVGQAFVRGANNTLGLCVAFVLLGALRELLGAGTLFGIPVLQRMLLPLATQPAGGFMLVGLVAAVWTAAGGSYVRFKQEEVRHLYADSKQ